jgi:hypothetical protein
VSAPSFVSGVDGRGSSAVRGTRASGERRLEQALAALARALDESAAPWMVIGGVAVIARGVRRMTGDIDAVVQGDRLDVRQLLRVLKRHGIVPRISRAADFARANLVLLARHRRTGVDFDISFGWTSFEIEAISARVPTRYGRVEVPMARAEDLVIFKALAARPRDIEDAAALLVLYPKTNVARIRHRLGELAALAGEPVLAEGLTRVLALARAAKRPRRR